VSGEAKGTLGNALWKPRPPASEGGSRLRVRGLLLLLPPLPGHHCRLIVLIAGRPHILLVEANILGAALAGAALDVGVPMVFRGGAVGLHQRLSVRLRASLGGWVGGCPSPPC